MTLEPDGWHLSIVCKITPPEQTARSKVSLPAVWRGGGEQSAGQVEIDVKKEIMPINKQSSRKHV